jgi:hypothetical protein
VNTMGTERVARWRAAISIARGDNDIQL